jgi:hypothetical protein
MRESAEKPLKVRWHPIETMILAVEGTGISASFISASFLRWSEYDTPFA